MFDTLQLSIAIPTYNRAVFLKHSLLAHDYIFGSRDVPIIISDNASPDSTAQIVASFQEKAQNICYFRNQYTIPPDENFEKVLGYSNSKYVWLLGDSYLIPENTFDAVQAAIEEDDYDLIVVNASGRVKGIQEIVFTDPNELLASLGWHMTCLSTLIYNRRLLQAANFKRYRNTNFIQTGIIYEYLAGKRINVKWISQHSVDSLKIPGHEKKSWENEAIRIWTKCWTDFVLSLPYSYDLDIKLKCIMDHGVKTNTLSITGLRYLRKKKYFNLELFRTYISYFPFSIKYPLFFLRIIAILPRWICKI
jgi:abequosyltransferase